MRGVAVAVAFLLLLVGGIIAYVASTSETQTVIKTGTSVVTTGPSEEEAERAAAERRERVQRIKELQERERALADEATKSAAETRRPQPPPKPEPAPDAETEPTPPAPATQASEKAVDVEKALDTQVTVAASGKSLTEVAELIGEAAGIAVNVDLEGADDIPITLQLSGVTARDALRTLAVLAGGLEVVDEGDHVTLRKRE